MVATRRGTRAGSPVKNTSDENSGNTTQSTPSTRRTRRKTLTEENQSQSDSQPDEPKDDSTASSLASPPKKDTRRSTRLTVNKKHPDSTHEADVSESESCCSVASGVQPTPRTRRRTAVREKRTIEEASEAESCSSAASATHSRTAPRSLRKRVLTSASAKDADASGAESCSSAVSLTKGTDTQRMTRSHQKTAVPIREADQSEPESCSSSVSGLRGSVVRRSTRNQKVTVTEPIPMNLEETTDAPSSPVSRKPRGRRRKTGVNDDESDGCKSGPSMSPWRSLRRQPKGDTIVGESDSESVATDICTSHGSPSPQRGRGTPCSSRTGSASSNRAVPVSRTRSKAKVFTAAMSEEQNEDEQLETHHEGIQAPEEQLDQTMTMETVEAQKCTINEEGAEDTTIVQDEPVEMLKVQSNSQEVGDHGTETKESGTETSLKEAGFAETHSESMVEVPEKVEKAFDNQTCAVPEKTESNQKDTAMVKEMAEVQTCSEPAKEETTQEASVKVEENAEVQTSSESSKEETIQTNVVLIEEVAEDQSSPEPAEEVKATQEDPEPALIEKKKGVTVTEESNELIKTTDDDSDAGPSTSSHTRVDLSTAQESSKERSAQKEMISLLDSSEDEDSGDEGLSAEEEGGSQEDEDDLICPDNEPMPEEAEAHGNGLFVIDTRPGLRPEDQYYVDAKQTEEEDEEEDYVDEEGDDEDDEDSKVLFAPKKPLMQLSTSIDTGLKLKELGGLYVSFDGNKPKTLSRVLKAQKDVDGQDELLKKSVIVPGFEKKDAVPPCKESKHAAKLKRKAEREKTTGDGWFNMRAPELTEELKNDLKALKMRAAMDPKRFYKKNDREGFPKYFQIGTVVDSPVDFYNSRMPKKQRKRTIVEELLADAEFRSSNKRRYQEIMAEKAAQAAGKQHRKKHTKFSKKTNK
ncbi:deoxynucleotidyltransferase terminal-interacting protein 2 isoform X2 [Danio aesculapii]|uniref:deoxynucleotidyltransferase terminal-interacting protein 2 isoform X2 n=1 Tax=Danio aesculapii TaxID=1142201 RepID=UPI0024BFF870|nr:deoxynucleotidyltransferase terminal-interacting protein 2 isoform X2 [Danio aesculapii]